MFLISRKWWFKSIMLVASLIIGGLLLKISPSWIILRTNVAIALQSTTLLFSIISALSMALYSNYIKGLKKNYLDKISIIRNLLYEFFDKHFSSKDKDIQEIIEKQIIPLMNLGNRDWLDFDNVKDMGDDIEKSLDRLHKRKKWFLPRNLLQLEDEINELGILYIRRVVAQIYIDKIRITFTLIIAGMLVIASSYLLPDNLYLNAILVAISITIIITAIIETLSLLSYVAQEAKEELDLPVKD